MEEIQLVELAGRTQELCRQLILILSHPDSKRHQTSVELEVRGLLNQRCRQLIARL